MPPRLREGKLWTPACAGVTWKAHSASAHSAACDKLEAGERMGGARKQGAGSGEKLRRLPDFCATGNMAVRLLYRERPSTSHTASSQTPPGQEGVREIANGRSAKQSQFWQGSGSGTYMATCEKQSRFTSRRTPHGVTTNVSNSAKRS